MREENFKGNYRHLIWSSWWGFIILGISTIALGTALPVIVDSFKLKLTQAGVLFFVLTASRTGAVLIGGLLSDRIGKRRILLFGAASLTAGLLLFGVSPGWLFLLVISPIIGMGAGIIDGGVNALVSEICSPNRGQELNLLHSFYGVGAFAGPLMIGYLISTFLGWRGAYEVTAFLAFTFFVFYLVQDFPSLREEDKINPKALIALLKERDFLFLNLLMVTHVGAQVTISAWLPTYLVKILLFPHIRASSGLSLFWLGLLVGRLLSSWISRRLSLLKLLMICIISSFFIYLLSLTMVWPPAVFLFFGLLGLSYSAVFPTVVALGSSLYPRYSGTVSGTLIASGSLGAAVVPSLVGILADRIGLRMAMAMASLVVGGMFLAFLPVYRQHRPEKH